MTRPSAIRPRLLTLLIACALATLPAAAQTPPDLTGTWQGTLGAAKLHRILVKISKSASGWSGVVYDLDGDMAYEGRNTTQMSLDGATFRFAIAPIATTFEGKLSPDGLSIAGTVTEAGGTASLTLAHVTGDAVWEIPKPDAPMARDADPDWEVATIKPSDPNDHNAGFHLNGRRVFIERMTVESMLIMSYGLQKSQIDGAPDWVTTDRWDVQGLPDIPGQPSVHQYQSMVRKILAERFGFKSHTETREMAVYALTVAKGGPKMTKSAGDPNGLLDEEDGSNGGQRSMQVTNATMADFALVMKFFMDRPIVDRTGLTGHYDFALKWTFDDSRAPTDGSAAPSLFTAVQEQLGLKLDPVKAPADVLVIDHIDRPSAN